MVRQSALPLSHQLDQCVLSQKRLSFHPSSFPGDKLDAGTSSLYAPKRGNWGECQAGEMQQWMWCSRSFGLWTRRNCISRHGGLRMETWSHVSWRSPSLQARGNTFCSTAPGCRKCHIPISVTPAKSALSPCMPGRWGIRSRHYWGLFPFFVSLHKNSGLQVVGKPGRN